ncbi:MAG TPA: RIP metalloprotease RseP [Methylomirabilota bacterium]|nr:RIP metalloprotease RseP [Methylomirabilota bacterium]
MSVSYMDILKFCFILLEVVILFNFLILVHELGHYLAAKWRGLKVERFAIWFGKPIWEKKINGVSFCLGSIPAGGYVALPQMAPMEAIEGKREDEEPLPPISALDKIIVAFAGPLFSFGLAFLFALVVWGIGRPVSERETSTVIGYVLADSPADEVGLLPGDEILSVDGEAVQRFSGVAADSVMWRIIRSEGETVAITVKRGEEVLTFHPKPEKPKTAVYQRKGLRYIGVEPAFTPMIARVAPDSPAEEAGLKANDFIVAVNGKKVFHTAEISKAVEAAGTTPLALTVQRQKESVDVTVTPEIPVEGDQVPRLGVVWDSVGKLDLVYPGPGEQVIGAVDTMVSTIGAIISPKSDISAQHLSGPVGILRIYYLLFESDQGWRLAIWFSVVLNVNLAILNLLPIPVLDGGHIVLALIEAMRRKPMNVTLLNWIQTGCAVLLIGYILYVTFYDVQDLKPRGAAQEVEWKFAPGQDTGPPGNAD